MIWSIVPVNVCWINVKKECSCYLTFSCCSYELLQYVGWVLSSLLRVFSDKVIQRVEVFSLSVIFSPIISYLLSEPLQPLSVMQTLEMGNWYKVIYSPVWIVHPVLCTFRLVQFQTEKNTVFVMCLLYARPFVSDSLWLRKIDNDDGRTYELEQSAVKCMRGILYCYMRQSRNVSQNANFWFQW